MVTSERKMSAQIAGMEGMNRFIARR